MSKHLKRIAAPSFWKISKKAYAWVVRPRAGPHKLEECFPLLIIVRDILKLADNAKEAKKIIKMGEILVDGKVRKDHKFPVGLFDVISIPKMKKFYRIVPARKGLKLIEIDEKESKVKLCKIRNKTIVKNGKVQLNLHDGKNILVDDPTLYKTGDSLLLELPTLKILEHIKLEKGNLGIVIKGKRAGKMGEIEKIVVTRTKDPTRVICKMEGESVEILKEYFFVVGKEKPLIKVSE